MLSTTTRIVLGILGTLVPLVNVANGTPIGAWGYVATATGLAVAIAALVPYNFFQRRTEALAETIERYGSRLELLLAEAPAVRREAA